MFISVREKNLSEIEYTQVSENFARSSHTKKQSKLEDQVKQSYSQSNW